MRMGISKVHQHSLSFQADLSNLTLDKAIIDSIVDVDINIDNDVLNSLVQAKKEAIVEDFYTVYLWNYCAWDGSDKFSFCSKREAYFTFDPVEVWKLQDTGVEKVFPDQLANGLKLYKTVTKWMFIAYVVALVTTILELLVGISALFSRWGSLFTTLISGVRPPAVFQPPPARVLRY
jgi:hypothetical protein